MCLCCAHRFGRTPSRWQTHICQSVFQQLEARGFLLEQSMDQLYRCGVIHRALPPSWLARSCMGPLSAIMSHHACLEPACAHFQCMGTALHMNARAAAQPHAQEQQPKRSPMLTSHSEALGKFLADRYVTGVCPKCRYEVCALLSMCVTT